MPISRRALTLLGVIPISVSALADTGAAAQGCAGGRSDRPQKLPGKPVRRAPAVAPIVVGPAPRILPGSRLFCASKQVRVCGTMHCGPNGCPYSCRMEARCIPYGQ
jgi:hypothetical protein